MEHYYYLPEVEPEWNWTIFTDVPPTPTNEPMKAQFIHRVEHRVIGYIHKH